MALFESGEMYLETIYVLSQTSNAVRGIDIADHLKMLLHFLISTTLFLRICPRSQSRASSITTSQIHSWASIAVIHALRSLQHAR